ncbi:MYXO-CTERM sorting domain-containing protein [Sandaracinus amylolyticus]|uniref:Tryptophan synthase alpha chain n=1 Tax=Sandaracinus amylolyticus TaxID=927083 RepID=A0A0F6VZJ5_9BACT|nr:MYXO-CTERM sorting domain-containing protein [Sandaracinus amylolyticus]AKF03637.1 Tryptophan synthase alpha chain [Sandaracinus amylolyticus]
MRASPSRFASFVLCLPLLVSLVSLARAQVTQPNGMVMPRDSLNGEVQLYTLFSSRGETIDFQADGESEPALFSPLCDFRATFLLRESASSYAVGWYNADPARATPPDASEIYTIVPAGAPVGTVITGADIRGDARYLGGLIGFALTGGQTHYTEARYNPVCTGCATPNPWVMAVIYRSTVTPNAFYVAFEDGSVGSQPSSFNNDGDYNDYVYFFEGLQCSGGGEACDTGMPGICAAGVTECSGDGITCRMTVTGRDEACNGLDDDCDGETDDGDLCDEDEVCDRGVCVGRCLDEFGCARGLDCNAAGYCVESACVDVVCDAGEICRAGACIAPCDGVVCPGDQACRAGRCVDPCAAVTCDAGRVCQAGACVQSCECAPCSDELECHVSSGLCTTSDCASVDCSGTPGTVCRGGSCVDACDGAVCPRGQICEGGSCVVDPDFGVDAGVERPDSGVVGVDAGASEMDAGSVVDAGADAGRGPRGRSDDDGCGCRAAGAGRGGEGAIAMIVLLALAIVRRRRA